MIQRVIKLLRSNTKSIIERQKKPEQNKYKEQIPLQFKAIKRFSVVKWFTSPPFKCCSVCSDWEKHNWSTASVLLKWAQLTATRQLNYPAADFTSSVWARPFSSEQDRHNELDGVDAVGLAVCLFVFGSHCRPHSFFLLTLQGCVTDVFIPNISNEHGRPHFLVSNIIKIIFILPVRVMLHNQPSGVDLIIVTEINARNSQCWLLICFFSLWANLLLNCFRSSNTIHHKTKMTRANSKYSLEMIIVCFEAKPCDVLPARFVLSHAVPFKSVRVCFLESRVLWLSVVNRITTPLVCALISYCIVMWSRSCEVCGMKWVSLRRSLMCNVGKEVKLWLWSGCLQTLFRTINRSVFLVAKLSRWRTEKWHVNYTWRFFDRCKDKCENSDVLPENTSV